MSDDDVCQCACGKRGCVSAGRRIGVLTHGASGYSSGCRCDACRAGHIRKQQRRRQRMNAQSLEAADRHGQVWTGPELEMVLREDLTAREVARLLGRSFKAVSNMRTRCRRDPKYAALAGQADA